MEFKTNQVVDSKCFPYFVWICFTSKEKKKILKKERYGKPDYHSLNIFENWILNRLSWIE